MVLVHVVAVSNIKFRSIVCVCVDETARIDRDNVDPAINVLKMCIVNAVKVCPIIAFCFFIWVRFFIEYLIAYVEFDGLVLSNALFFC